MVVHTFEEFVQVLEGKRVPHRAYASARLVELESGSPLPGPLQIKWETKVSFINVGNLVLRDIPQDRLRELETAVARINHHLPVLGFGLDTLGRVLYFRVAVPVFADGINPDTLDQLAKGVIGNATEFMSSFGAVVQGRPGDEVTEIHKQITHSRNPHLMYV
jgi:putative sensory transduction regulator